MKLFLILSALIASGLIACSKTEHAQIDEITPSAKIKIDLSTPDKALKSYWSVKDSVRTVDYETWSKNGEVIKSAVSQLTSVADDALARSLITKVRPLDTFVRDIIDVKVESESRAVIFATIKNTTPIPKGADLTARDEEDRRDGHRYRYVLERSQENWRVSEIWEWREYPSHTWNKMHPRDEKPYASTYTFEGV